MGVRSLVLIAGVVVLASCSSSAEHVRSRAGRPAETTATAGPETSTSGPAAVASTPTSKPGGAATATAPSTNEQRATPIAATAPAQPPAAATGDGAIIGHVYRGCAASASSNAAGSASACGPVAGIPDVTVNAKSGATTVASTRTAADGTYRLEVPAGVYDVQESTHGYTSRVYVEAGKSVAADFTVPTS